MTVEELLEYVKDQNGWHATAWGAIRNSRGECPIWAGGTKKTGRCMTTWEAAEALGLSKEDTVRVAATADLHPHNFHAAGQDTRRIEPDQDLRALMEKVLLGKEG